MCPIFTSFCIKHCKSLRSIQGRSPWTPTRCGGMVNAIIPHFFISLCLKMLLYYFTSLKIVPLCVKFWQHFVFTMLYISRASGGFAPDPHEGLFPEPHATRFVHYTSHFPLFQIFMLKKCFCITFISFKIALLCVKFGQHFLFKML